MIYLCLTQQVNLQVQVLKNYEANIDDAIQSQLRNNRNLLVTNNKFFGVNLTDNNTPIANMIKTIN